MINLLVANSTGQLTKQLPKIKKAFNKAKDICERKLALDKVDVLLIPDNSWIVIPETHIGGHAYDRNYVHFPVDTRHELDFDEIVATLCHELHHAKRYDGPGYGTTLLGRLVFEGLAIRFEEEAGYSNTLLPKYVGDYQHLKDLVQKARIYLDHKHYDNLRWFYKDKSNNLPRWAGYILGYHIVGEYLESNKLKASEAALEPVASFRNSRLLN